MIVHQYHHSLAPGDAVFLHTQFLRQSLSHSGVMGSVFCSERRGLSEAQAKIWSRGNLAEAMHNADLLLIHHSQGNPDLPDLLQLPGRKAFVYHNITPAKFFAHDKYIAGLSELGRKQLELFLKAGTTAFSVSEYNARELKQLGFSEVTLLPLFDLAALRRRFGHQTTSPATPLRKNPRLLFCGRLVPHKNQEALIQTLFHLHTDFGIPARLDLVGGGDPFYRFYLQRLTRDLGLTESVTFHGKLTESAYAANYALADLFVSMSLHEGFCIPLVEAMAAGVPIVALGQAAVPETLGGHAVELLSAEPRHAASIWAALLDDGDLRRQIVLSQNRHLDSLSSKQEPLTAKHLGLRC